MIFNRITESQATTENEVLKTDNQKPPQKSAPGKKQRLENICRKLSSSLKNKSESNFIDLVKTYAIEIKNNNLKVTKNIFNKMIELGLEFFNASKKSTSSENPQSRDATQLEVERAVFDILDWESFTLQFKKRLIELHVIEGQVDALEKIIQKNDPEMGHFMKKEFPYWAIKHNQLKVLNLALEQLRLDKKDMDRIKTRLIEASIEQGHEEISIDLIVNKKVKITKSVMRYAEKYASDNLKNILKLKLAKPDKDFEKSNDNLIEIKETTSISIKPKLTRLVVEDIIAKGTIGEIIEVIQGDNSEIIDYLKKQMVTSALASNRSDMLKVAFEKLYSDKTVINHCVYGKLKWASINADRERVLQCLIDSGFIKSVSLKIYSSVIENHSESVAERIFGYTYRSWRIASSEWQQIYQVAQTKNYYKINFLIDEHVFCKPVDTVDNLNIPSEILNTQSDIDVLLQIFEDECDVDALLNSLNEFQSNSNEDERAPNEEQIDWDNFFDNSNNILKQFDYGQSSNIETEQNHFEVQKSPQVKHK